MKYCWHSYIEFLKHFHISSMPFARDHGKHGSLAPTEQNFCWEILSFLLQRMAGHSSKTCINKSWGEIHLGLPWFWTDFIRVLHKTIGVFGHLHFRSELYILDIIKNLDFKELFFLFRGRNFFFSYMYRYEIYKW